MPRPRICIAMLLSALTLASAAPENPKAPWSPLVQEVQIASSADGTPQPSMLYLPETDHPVPLLVSLHTWSGDHTQSAAGRAAWCHAKGWAFVHPNFRGPNNKPSAMGSDLAVQDILDAVAHVRERIPIDPDRIYLVGFSGGGHCALLMAGRAPELWAGVSAACGISDLRKWHAQNPGYGRGIEAAAGGNPQEDERAAAECARRSPATWLPQAAAIAIDIKAGIRDGHPGGGSVPVSQSLEAFNLLAAPEDRIAEEEVAAITRDQAIPEALRGENGGGRLHEGRLKVLFQRQSRNARVTLFDGGHQGADCLQWLSLQKKGSPAVWDSPADLPAAAATAGSAADAASTGR